MTIPGTPGILKDMLNQGATLDRVFQALADPSRRGMVERLSRHVDVHPFPLTVPRADS